MDRRRRNSGDSRQPSDSIDLLQESNTKPIKGKKKQEHKSSSPQPGNTTETTATSSNKVESMASGDQGGDSPLLERKDAILRAARSSRTPPKITREFAKQALDALTKLNTLTDVKARSKLEFDKLAKSLQFDSPIALGVDDLEKLKKFYKDRKPENSKEIDATIDPLIETALGTLVGFNREAQQKEEKIRQEEIKRQEELLLKREMEEQKRQEREDQNRIKREEEKRKVAEERSQREANLRSNAFWQAELGADVATILLPALPTLALEQLESLAKYAKLMDPQLLKKVLQDSQDDEDIIGDVADVLLKNSALSSDSKQIVGILQEDLSRWYSSDNAQNRINPNPNARFTGFKEFLDSQGNLSTALRTRYQEAIGATQKDVGQMLVTAATGAFGENTPAVATAIPWSKNAGMPGAYGNAAPPFGWVNRSEQQLFDYVDQAHGALGLHPLLQENVRAQIRNVLQLSEEERKINGVPGLHAEVFAVNQALWQRYQNGANELQDPVHFLVLRGRTALGADEGKATVQEHERGRDMPPCPNCQAILKGQKLIKKDQMFKQEMI